MKLQKVTYHSKIWYHTKFQDCKLSDVSVAPTSEVRIVALLLDFKDDGKSKLWVVKWPLVEFC